MKFNIICKDEKGKERNFTNCDLEYFKAILEEEGYYIKEE